MAQYKNGIATNESIISVAKESFLQEGFKKATIASICKKCDIKLGTFTYYYNKKEDLLQTIYTSYMQNCRDYISSKNLNLSSYEKHIYVVTLYYYNIYHHKEIFEFHREVLSITSMNSVFKNPKEMIDDFVIGGTIKEDNPLYDLFVKADNAVRREFNLIYFSKEHSSMDDIKQLLADIYFTAASLFGLDISSVLTTIDNAYNFVKTEGDTSIRLL